MCEDEGLKRLEDFCVDKFIIKCWKGVSTTSKRLNLNNPTLSRRDATEGSGRRRSVGIRVRHSISVSKTRNHNTISKVASLRDALVAVVHSSPHCAPLSLSVVLLR